MQLNVKGTCFQCTGRARDSTGRDGRQGVSLDHNIHRRMMGKTWEEQVFQCFVIRSHNQVVCGCVCSRKILSSSSSFVPCCLLACLSFSWRVTSSLVPTFLRMFDVHSPLDIPCGRLSGCFNF